ncbi:hypothetical protein [Acrocarpospora sp. B8E8]|uniref:hypothetical protein n=1 Tax=Acrocarpospora sp. B8E8 TaxID=3153572 RepID=UPI00325F1D02
MNAEPASDGVPADDERPEEAGAGEEAPEKDAQALGQEFSTRAAQPGSTRERLSAERDARSNFSSAQVHAGKVVGGDEITYITMTTGQAKLQLFALPQEDLELDLAFVDPPGGAQVAAAANARRLVIVRGRPGAGKFALTLHVLLRLALGPIRRLHPETDLSTLTLTGLGAGGYVLADLTAEATARLRSFDINRLAAELTDEQRLIIVISDDARLPELDRYIVEARPPELMDVLNAHLIRRLGSSSAAPLLADPEIASLCQARLRDSTAYEAFRLAALIADEEPPVVATVRDRLRADDGFDLAQWFSGLGDLETQTLAIGVAVLAGEPYALVAGASEALCRRLEPADQPPKPTNPFGPTTSIRLRRLNAHLVSSTMATRHGATVPGQVVRYQDRTRALRLLLHVWDEYDEIRPKFLTWLRLCPRSEVPTVRVRAAIAAGLLATRAFDHIRSTIISPWATAPTSELRDAAASALGVASDDPALRGAVRGLVSAWAADTSAPRLRATAARAWRVKIENDGCADVLKLFDELGGSAEPAVVEAICESVTEMIEYDDSMFAADAITLLRKWMADPNRSVTGQLAFLLAAADLVRQLPGGTWPALLDIAAADAALAREIGAAWAKVLNSADMNQAAKEVLAEWARAVDQNAAARLALGRLMVVASTTSRTERIISLAAARWAHAPQSKNAVLAALSPVRSAL